MPNVAPSVLTRMGKKVIQMTAHEKNLFEIADEMGISESTVTKIKQSLREKFDCRSMIGVVYYATKFDLV
jgi:DNA-binding CsgD family transcriptional regulator